MIYIKVLCIHTNNFCYLANNLCTHNKSQKLCDLFKILFKMIVLNIYTKNLYKRNAYLSKNQIRKLILFG